MPRFICEPQTCYEGVGVAPLSVSLPQPLRLWFSIALLTLLLAPSSSWAQSRFSLGADAGASFPLGHVTRDIVVMDPTWDPLPQEGIPALMSRHVHPGFHVGINAFLSAFELRYRLEYFRWAGGSIHCQGDSPAHLLPDGEVEDAGVNYDCGTESPVERLAGDDGFGLMYHHLGLGLRFSMDTRVRSRLVEGELVEQQPARLWLAPGVGVTAALYDDPHIGRQFRPGMHAALRAGADIPLERRLWLTFEISWQGALVSSASSTIRRSSRVEARDGGPIAALFDRSHRLGLSAGIRYDFR